MPRRLRWGAVPGQETVRFDGPRTINTRAYDFEQAKEATRYRRKRSADIWKAEGVGDRKAHSSVYAKGFNSRVSGLWIPHSGTESTAVVRIPEDYALQNRMMIRDKVLEKYADSEEVSERRARLYAVFASHQSVRGLRAKYGHYIINAAEGFAWINAGLGPNGEIERDRVEANKYAVQGVAEYIVYLRTLVGTEDVLSKRNKIPDDPDAPRRRLWPQDRWKNVWAGRLAIAKTYLDGLPDEEFDKTVMEAYYSERSRHEYWKGVRDDYHEELKRRGHVDLLNQARRVPTMDELVADPHNDDLNYVDDEYIG